MLVYQRVSAWGTRMLNSVEPSNRWIFHPKWSKEGACSWQLLSGFDQDEALQIFTPRLFRTCGKVGSRRETGYSKKLAWQLWEHRKFVKWPQLESSDPRYQLTKTSTVEDGREQVTNQFWNPWIIVIIGTDKKTNRTWKKSAEIRAERMSEDMPDRTASCWSEWALLDFNCELQISVGTAVPQLWGGKTRRGQLWWNI